MPNHPDDQLLVLYSFDRSAVDDVASLEAHLDACPDCRKALEQHQAFDTLLADAHAWPGDETDVTPPAALRELSALAARNREEDADASARLDALLDAFVSGDSDAFLWADIASNPDFHTGGVVRKLADAAYQALYKVPRRSLILAETAGTIVGMLPTGTYSSIEIAALRGLAWKECANANRFLGRFSAATEALGRAERAFRELRRPELDLASITYIRATIYCEQQDYDRAQAAAQESTAAFERLGQTGRYFASLYLQGCIAFEQRALGEAQSIFAAVLAYGETNGDIPWIARASLALGNCYLERGDLVNASRSIHEGMLAFREIKLPQGEIRCRWALALVVQREGRHRTAVERLRRVRDEFTALGGLADAALVSLDIMETCLALGQPREVRRAAGNIVKLFKENGMITGALTAADYLKQSVAMQSVSPSVIDYIRRYFRRLEVEPELAFVPPTL